MTLLSVNINKLATLRNSRGSNIPNIINFTINIQKFGADGITIHPRPDQRHIKYKDVFQLKKIINNFNIEGYPSKKFINLVLKIKPNQVTLVPDKNNVITSNAGWNVVKHQIFLTDIINELKLNNIRTSIFIEPDPQSVYCAAKIGADCIELYTKQFAKQYNIKNYNIINKYILSAKIATDAKLIVNAGHDLNIKNIEFLIKNIPCINEVSIGHSLIVESLYWGLEKTIKLYLKKIKL